MRARTVLHLIQDASLDVSHKKSSKTAALFSIFFSGLLLIWKIAADLTSSPNLSPRLRIIKIPSSCTCYVHFEGLFGGHVFELEAEAARHCAPSLRRPRTFHSAETWMDGCRSPRERASDSIQPACIIGTNGLYANWTGGFGRTNFGDALAEHGAYAALKSRSLLINR